MRELALAKDELARRLRSQLGFNFAQLLLDELKELLPALQLRDDPGAASL